MPVKRPFYFPPQLNLDVRVVRSPVQQLAKPEVSGEAEVHQYHAGSVRGQIVTQEGGRRTLVVARPVEPPITVDAVLQVPGGAVPTTSAELRGPRRVAWLKPAPGVDANDPGALARLCQRIRGSWADQFSFKEERRLDADRTSPGLRAPQLGAVHAALAHWVVTDDPATIVMPTGTGKTDTMLALLIARAPHRLLVVVPNAALREQIAGKFLTLGVLKEFGVVGPGALYPVVGTLHHRPRTPDEAATYFGCCNVVVTTMSVIGGCSDEVQRKIAELCSHLFIDEAHHVSAPTWFRFRELFADKVVLQFTATPFRSDRKAVDGTMVFTYPLRKAQEEGYFQPVVFRPVAQFSQERADQEIARVAVSQLEEDLANGFDHVVLARARDIRRAEEVYALYHDQAAAHHPLLIHSELPDRERHAAIQLLRERKSRVGVCVDMFGEGFDLPELKIAAMHDIHKSLAITLQFAGRFTRTKSTTGDATVIANIADPEVEESLRELYAEDSDWNSVLRQLSEGATGRQRRRTDFLESFRDVPREIPIQNVFPTMSAVVYRVKKSRWMPEKIKDAVPASRLFAGPAVSEKEGVLLFVTREMRPVPWGAIREVSNLIWDLYLVHWDRERRLLFINSSNNDSTHEEIARAVAGDEIELIRGETVFRCMHGVRRLILQTLGLNHSLSRAVRFTMHVGGDIAEGLATAHYQNKIKSNLFGRGYERGEQASIGCSQKGRIWSRQIAYDLSEWVEWCHLLGDKLLDDRILPGDLMEHVIIPEPVADRPPLVPLAIEWSEYLLQRSEEAVELSFAGELVPLYDVGLELVTHAPDGPLRFRVFSESKAVEYEVRFRENEVVYVPVSGDGVEIIIARRRHSLASWFQQESPVFLFKDGGFLVYNQFAQPKQHARVPFPPERLMAWDWTGTDLKKESQTEEKHADSIQYRLLRELSAAGHDPAYDVLYDDDASNEAADVVAFKIAGERLLVHLFHCKYASGDAPGGRVDDLYAVCGQAQRSVRWKGDIQALIDHLRRREGLRMRRGGVSRFERGDLAKLQEIARAARYLTPEFRIYMVQPGLSRAKATQAQLELLGATELYLRETYEVPLGVITSA